MRKPVNLDVARVGGETRKQWRVKADGVLLGLVSIATGPDEGGLWYRACYLVGDESVCHPDLFGGEFGNVAAVACILDRARP